MTYKHILGQSIHICQATNLKTDPKYYDETQYTSNLVLYITSALALMLNIVIIFGYYTAYRQLCCIDVIWSKEIFETKKETDNV